ncbi:Fe-S protein assembly chaperone HscA domain-containing protein [Spironucleus salmonicida]|uniref:Fe-S protein assembly chaperone HscA domain-containing protein n=2 Tax=Spironucleus salmonicida TaxID=348837 RepID=A0A9P8LU02_9EUKA|nr:Fe-S protein assembly chaperone HscA domain-containing protein [Spironucleus salmonicida]
MTQICSAAADCGSSHYSVCYRTTSGTIQLVNLRSENVSSKQPSTAYVSIEFTDVKQLPPDSIYYGSSPPDTLNYAFFPNWKNYFFDADEIVCYPNVPSVPSKNHRSIRVTCASLFEGFMFQAVKSVRCASGLDTVELAFLIPSVARAQHLDFIKLCAQSVEKRTPCKITLIYEGKAALGSAEAIGDFGGFTFDKATKQNHESCNLAASNIDNVVDQLVRADFVDLRFHNRHLLYQRIMELKNDYTSGDVFLDLTGIFDPFQFYGHYALYSWFKERGTTDGFENGAKQFLQTIPFYEDGERCCSQYFHQRQISMTYVDFRQQMLEYIRNFNDSSEFKFIKPCQEFNKLIKIVQNRKVLKKVLTQALCFEDFNSNERIVCICQQLVSSHSQQYQSLLYKAVADISLQQWKKRLNSNFLIIMGEFQSQTIIESYKFSNDKIGISLPSGIYQQICTAVCAQLANNFGLFLQSNKCKTFKITGGFSQSPFLLNQLAQNSYIQQITKKSKDSLIQHIKKSLIIPPYEIVKNAIGMKQSMTDSENLIYKHYYLNIDKSGNLKYEEVNVTTSHKNRVCIDEGTSGSLLSYIPAGHKYTDDMTINDLPAQQDRIRKIDDVEFKAGTKTPSFCVVDIPAAYQLATSGLSLQHSEDLSNYQQVFDKYFTLQMLPISDIRRIFLFGNVNKDALSEQLLSNNHDDATLVQSSKPMSAKEKLLRKKQEAQAKQEVEPEPKSTSVEEVGQKLTAKQKMALAKLQKTQQQTTDVSPSTSGVHINEFLIVDYWKRYLYQNQQVQYPLNPQIVQRYTFNGQSIELKLPVAYFYISHLSHFYHTFIQDQGDMVSYYNQLGLTLTVPCAAKQQHLTFLRECCRVANLPDDIVFVYEPNSAFSFIFHQDRLRGTNIFKDGYVIVVDVGGGTTDVSLLKVDTEGGTFNVINFYEINYAGNNVIDKVFENLGVQSGLLQQLSSGTRSQFRESVKSQIELLTVLNSSDRNVEEVIIVIESKKNKTSDAENLALEQLYAILDGLSSCYNDSEQRLVKIREYQISSKLFYDSIGFVQQQIQERTLDFSDLNRILETNYKVQIVCAGGMGSSLSFRSSFTEKIKTLKYSYIKLQETPNFQSAIARGGLFLKSEKDYVDFGAPFIQRGSEEEEKFIDNNEILMKSTVHILTFRYIQLALSIQKSTFIESGKRWSQGDVNITATSSYNGISFAVHVEHKWSVIGTTSNYFYLCQVPLEYINLLHPQENSTPAGWVQYLYDINITLSKPDNILNILTDIDKDKRPFAALTVDVSLKNSSTCITSNFNLFRYFPVDLQSLQLEKEKGKIFISQCCVYHNLVQYIDNVKKNYGKHTILCKKCVLKLPIQKWKLK